MRQSQGLGQVFDCFVIGPDLVQAPAEVVVGLDCDPWVGMDAEIPDLFRGLLQGELDIQSGLEALQGLIVVLHLLVDVS